LRAIATFLAADCSEASVEVLAPQQLAVGVSSGISILIHGIRLVLEQHPTFVVVKLDLKNCFNALSRSVMLRRMASHPRLAHLVPFLHALGATPTDLLVGGEKLFGTDRAGSEEGVLQGMGLSSLACCVCIHPELCALDAELKKYGGCARAITDDVYACGPAHVVFPALQRFAASLREMTDLEVQPPKYACWSPEYDLATCPHRAALGAPVGTVTTADGHTAFGLTVGGVPMGDDEFICETLRDKVGEIVKLIETTSIKLHDHLHESWSSLFYSHASRFDYWLRHLPPKHTIPHALRIDQALLAAAQQLGYDGMFDDDLTLRRFHLPARMRGCGIRSREMIAPIAYVACFIECAEVFCDGSASLAQGFFPMLSQSFGDRPFASDGLRFSDYLQSSLASAETFMEVWEELRQSIEGPYRRPGPLDRDAGSAGSERSTESRLQRAITQQVEQVNRDRLHAEISALRQDDPRRESWTAVDLLSSQFITAFPTARTAIDGQLFREMFTTYLGAESPALRPLAGRSIPCGSATGQARPPVCDPHGRALGTANLPGGGWTDCHDGCGGELFSIMMESGISVELEPWRIFSTLIPTGVLMSTRQPPAIIPDASAHVAMPPSATARGVPQPRQAQPAKQLLFDIKTTYGGSSWYKTARARDDQSGAVAARAHAVVGEYRRHARELDVKYSAQGTTPILDRLESFGPVRPLVMGQYAEASADVHALLRLAAEATARSRWRLIGARSAVEASNFFLQVYRRRLGLAIGREMARHRLHRVPFVGVPRAAMNARMRRGDPGLGGGGPVIHPVRAVDFLGFQQHIHAHDVRVGA